MSNGNTLTPSFPVEIKKSNIESVNGSDNFIVDKEVEKAINKVFESVIPKEASKNHVSVGGGGFENDYSYSFYNPHNARYYFSFDKWNFNKNSLVGGGFEVINSKELKINYKGCRIVVKKNLIEITNQINTERLFKIDGSLFNRKVQVQNAVTLLEKEVIQVLRSFVSDFGGSTDFLVKKVWIPDNKILHDKLIDRLPFEMTWRDEVSKKVYLSEPKNVEINRLNIKVNSFDDDLNKLREVTLLEIENKKLHMEVLNEMKISLKAIQESLSKPLDFLKSNILVKDDLFKFNSEIRKLSLIEGKELFDWWFIKFNSKV